MNSKSTLLALLLALTVGGFYYYYEIKGGTSREETEKQQKKVFPAFKTDPPIEIGIRTSEQDEVYMAKEKGAWFIRKPFRVPMDMKQLQGVMDQLVNLSREEIIVAEGADLREFGLNVPSGTVSMKPISGKARTLFFGRDNPTGMFTYAMVDGEAAVFLVTRGVKQGVLKDVDTLRDKAVWRFNSSEINRIHSALKGANYRAEKDEEQRWFITQGLKKEMVKPFALSGFLQQALNLKIEKFVEEEESKSKWAKYGLGAQASRLEFRASDGKAYTLFLGGETADASAVFARRVGVPKIFTLPQGDVDALKKDPADLIQPTPTPTPQRLATPTPMPAQ